MHQPAQVCTRPSPCALQLAVGRFCGAPGCADKWVSVSWAVSWALILLVVLSNSNVSVSLLSYYLTFLLFKKEMLEGSNSAHFKYGH